MGQTAWERWRAALAELRARAREQRALSRNLRHVAVLRRALRKVTEKKRAA